MRAFDVQLGTAEPVLVRYPKALSDEAAGAFESLLPFTTTVRQSEWCGQAAIAQAPSSSFSRSSGSDFRAASLYPGWLAWDPSRRTILLSYGKAEYRSAAGLQYAWMLGCAPAEDETFLADIAALHNSGQAQLAFRPASREAPAPANGRQIVLHMGREHHVFELLDTIAPESVKRLLAALPLTVSVKPGKWSGDLLRGQVAELGVSGSLVPEHAAASLYPGTLALSASADGGWELVLSYGRAEFRHSEGMAYATPIARIDQPIGALRRLLGPASLSSDCAIRITAE